MFAFLFPVKRVSAFPQITLQILSPQVFFCLATFPSVGFVAILIAIVVSYSRVYVGVHFPLDVVCGGILGLLCATLIYRFYVLLFTL